ncbi:recombinase family protein [Dokdonella soli]|uniref:Recombinase family protein n=1 Tax=Dokdonella soli TaxID=529810 RepID=A0ABN1IE42_9GAMM
MNRLLRCAIYTRKSSEEGLEQDFNSLDAQREACAAYIQSQRHEGWKLVPIRYDDGGFSGGNLDRPALTQLLADLDASKIDLIVVYKVDRLTRSLSDFAKLVDRLDARGASFVSVTQSFNTTTSMGRLTLNVLLSFAQFEREVTGERIRDKIAASKKKGMWMGGYVPNGYDCIDRRLVVNEREARHVQRIFELYRDLGNVEKLKAELAAEGITSKFRTRRNGEEKGGCAFSNGALFAILGNRIYRGEISHKGQIHAGQHEPIIDDELWSAVQATRQRTRQRAAGAERAKPTSSLRGLITDELWRRYEPVHTTKGGRRYRYYVSRKQDDAGHDRKQGRLPAEALEQHVADRLATYLASPDELFDTLTSAEDDAACREHLLSAVRRRTAGRDREQVDWTLYRSVLTQIVVRPASIDLLISRQGVRNLLGVNQPDESPATFTLRIDARLYRTGHDLRLVVNNGPVGNEAGVVDKALLKLIARGRRWYEQLTFGQRSSLREIAQAEKLDERYVARILYGSLLAPDIIEKVIQGRQPVEFTVKSLKRFPPLDWDEQRRLYGMPR